MTADDRIMETVPFADLGIQHAALKEEIEQAITEVISQSAFIRGPFVERFEHSFADALGVAKCVSCANGTDAIYIAMKALGVGPGDEVIVPAMSWISTSETVTQTGAQVVFCDITPDTYTIDPADVAAKITDRTVGIIPVHIYGQPADMKSLAELAYRYGLWLIEDTAQAHLAQVDGRVAGTIGTVGTFSFYPGKNLGAMGDAGAVVTADPQLAERMAMFARHGGLVKGQHDIEGINSRLDGLQAAILSVKLPHLAKWTEARQAIARRYINGMSGTPGLTLPVTVPGRKHVWHLFVMQHVDRDGLRAHLTAEGIASGIHYPIALPFLPCYAKFGHMPADFPVVHAMQSRIVSLPIYPEMTEASVDRVIDAVQRFCEG